LEAFGAEIVRKAEGVVADATDTLKGTSYTVKSEIVTGQAAQQILEAAKRQGSDLIILGARRHSGTGSFLLGSVADKVLRFAHCSVLVYINGHDYEVPMGKTRVLLGYDYSPMADKALRFLKTWHSGSLKGIDLLECAQGYYPQMEAYAPTFATLYPAPEVGSEERLAQCAQELREAMPDVPVTSKVVYGPFDIATDLNLFAKNHNCSLIMVGSKGRTLFDQIFLGSVSARLAHGADLPVLVVR
jgi:nucleotide-binding universal stress UspA family protein